MTHWSLRQPQDLIAHVYAPSTQRADIAALAALVQTVALRGDAVAGAILQDAGQELAVAVEAVARRLALTGAIPCALTGSVILKGQSVRAAFVAATVERGLTLSPLTPVHEPAQGAIRLARVLL